MTVFFRICMAFLFAMLSSHTFAEDKPTYLVGIHNDDVTSKILFDSISKEFNVDIDYVYFSNFASILSATAEGQVDFVAQIVNNKKRAEILDFSAPTNVSYTYYFSHQKFKPDEHQVIAVPKGTIFYKHLLELFPHVEVIEYTTVEEAKQLIDEKKAVGAVASINYLKPMLKFGFKAHLINSDFPLRPVSIATMKGKNTDFLHRIEAYVQEAKVQRLLRDSVKQYQFDAQLEALRNEVIATGIDTSIPLKVEVISANSFGIYHADGHVSGIAADVLFEACKLLAFECELTSKADEPWVDMYRKLFSHQVDILSSVAITKDRQGVLNFSRPFFTKNMLMVKRKGYKRGVYKRISELFSERIGVIEGAIFEDIIRDKLTNKNIELFSNRQDLIDALLNHEVDYIVMSEISYNNTLRDAGFTLPIEASETIGKFFSYDTALAFQNNEQGKILAQLFSDAISLMDLGSIINRYDTELDWKLAVDSQKQLTRLSLFISIVIVCVLAWFFYSWRKQSRRDNLTHLHNRFALYQKYSRGISEGRALIYFDVNKFKPINDIFGHSTGDEVLKQIAKNIKSYWKYDSYRIGGDEFILIGKYESRDELHDIMSKIGFFNVQVDEDNQLHVTISYGCYISDGQKRTLEEMIHLADTEMYTYKDH